MDILSSTGLEIKSDPGIPIDLFRIFIIND